ncbi:MAG: hypothetical protein JWM49_671 [Microbacteriaceae bacterium]|jgi:capsular polysaccharide biosynthesis protein|nr:hypothetical protein [Microbacteriaceae bacterium]
MENQGYFRIFRDRWIALILGVLVGVWVASAVATSIPRTYTASAMSFLSVQSGTGSLVERSQFSLARITSYPELAHSSEVLSNTIRDLGLNTTVQQLGARVTAENPPTTVLLQISADAPTPQQAAAIANSVAANVAAVVSNLENSAGDTRYSVTLEPRIPAQAPTQPSAPQLPIILGLGAIAGLALGLIVAILWARLDTGIRSASHVRRISGLPVLGELPWRSTPRSDRRRWVARRERIFRETQLTIRQANGAVIPDFLLLVPASRSASQPGVRLGLTEALAWTGRSACLVEGDFFGGIRSHLEVAGTGGLAEVLNGMASLDDAIVPVDGERFSLLPAGSPKHLPREYDAEQRIRGTISNLVSSFDVTIMEATSITQPATLELVGPYADGVVVLVRYGRTRSADLAQVMVRLRVMGIRPLGVVLTGVPPFRRSDLAAGWLPEDFNEVPRRSMWPLNDPIDAEATFSKHRTGLRDGAGPFTAITSEVEPVLERGAEFDSDEVDSDRDAEVSPRATRVAADETRQ